MPEAFKDQTNLSSRSFSCTNAISSSRVFHSSCFLPTITFEKLNLCCHPGTYLLLLYSFS
uniref:Uncharacterized protein n=1 Tax=Arundo donax TaxID=35708 RepID=A0A0A9BSG6_ARUDO